MTTSNFLLSHLVMLRDILRSIIDLGLTVAELFQDLLDHLVVRIQPCHLGGQVSDEPIPQGRR